MRTTTAAALAAAGALAVPATAHAAPTLALPASCLTSGQAVTVAGSGFAPDAGVTLSGGLAGSATTDALGAFRTVLDAPVTTTLRPRRFSVTAADASDPSIAAPAVTFGVVRRFLDGNYEAALSGAPRHRTTWRFAGFTAGRAVYGHFRHHGMLATYRFGVATGVCGTLTTRARRVPVGTIGAGLWTLQIDQARRFRAATDPHRKIRFRISLQPLAR